MTKKDYVALALTIRTIFNRHDRAAEPKIPELKNFAEDLIEDFAVYCKADNSLFNKARFKAACLEIGGSDDLQGL